MGTSTSVELSPEQKDIEFLGERCPFGDAELWHLYRSYQSIFYSDFVSSPHESFLQDLAAECFRRRQQNHPKLLVKHDDTEVESCVLTQLTLDQWMELVRTAEEKILPFGFGNRLYKAAFIPDGTESLYEGTSDISYEYEDSHTRRTRLERFFEGVSNSTRRGSKSILQAFCSTCKQETDGKIRATELICTGYRLALAIEFLREGGETAFDISLLEGDFTEEKTLRALARSIFEQRKKRLNIFDDDLDDDLVEIDDVLEWSDSVAPMFASILPSFFHHVLFPGKIDRPTGRTGYEYPWIPAESKKSLFFRTPSSPLLFTFGCLSAALGGSYFCLYTSSQDGLSFNRLQNALLGYSGPTLLIVRAADQDCVLGAFTASPWKESKDFYGNTDCFLFQVSPRTSIIRPSGNGRNFMYCNSFARSRGYDQQAHGIGFGGTPDQPRFFLPESFESCQASNRDLTFSHGRLLSMGIKFELENIEVWGVGGDDLVQAALGDRKKARSLKHESLQKARKVDRAQFLDDFQSGLVESKAFAHRSQVDHGRAASHEEDLERGKAS